MIIEDLKKQEKAKAKALKRVGAMKELWSFTEEPAAYNEGWLGFLESIELRGVNEWMFWFGASNCNYSVIRKSRKFIGLILESFGYYGEVLFHYQDMPSLLMKIDEDYAELRALAEFVKSKGDENDFSRLMITKTTLKSNAFAGSYFNIGKVIDKIRDQKERELLAIVDKG